MVRERIEYIDSLRGLAILLVVMGHTLESNGYLSSPCYNFIYSFHMPLFFFISGFVTEYSCKLDGNSNSIDYFTYIWKKFTSIMLPYLTWMLVVRPFFFASHSGLEYIKSALLTQLSSIISNGGGLWFLPCLFMLITIFVLWKIFLHKVCKADGIILELVSLSVLLVACLFFYSSISIFHSVSSYFVPFFMGVFMSKYQGFNNLIKNNKYIFAFTLITFCILDGYYAGIEGELWRRLLKMSTGLTAIAVLFHIFSNVVFNKYIKGLLTLIGKNTLAIYLIHWHFIQNVPAPTSMGLWGQFAFFGVAAVLISLSCVMVYKIIELPPFLSQVFWGKK